MSSITSMAGAVSGAISDGDTIYLAGFTHLIPFAAGHEIIRQEYSDLTVARATPDLVYDQLIAAGCVEKVIFSWAGNPGVGSLHAFRRAVEEGVPTSIELEEYTHFGMATRLYAGAVDLPFVPLKTFAGSDLPEHNDNIRPVTSPFGGEEVYAVPPLQPDVAVVRAQRADEDGNCHLWGIQGEQKEAALAAKTVILSVEELVDTATIRSDPNRTLVTADDVDYVVETPYGSHPSYAQGYYDRDNEAYLDWGETSRSVEKTDAWLEEYVYGVADRAEYIRKLPDDRLAELDPGTGDSIPVNFGGS
jgi:glutaconate CoA-transferase subunit A